MVRRPRPRKTVQVCVNRLRRVFGDWAEAIHSEADGYRLDPALVPVDADAFEAEVRQATAEPDEDRAAAMLRRALGRWRGDAFGDLRECMDLVPDAVQLDSRRLAAQHELFERVVQDAEARRAELEAQTEADGPMFKIADDPRVPRVGRLLRCLSVDEIPQFVNVLRREMSVVGPRPALLGDDAERPGTPEARRWQSPRHIDSDGASCSDLR